MNNIDTSIKLAVVDDHSLFRAGLVNLIKSLKGKYTILFEAENGKDLINKLQQNTQPDIILMDIEMPVMNGFEAAGWLKENMPNIHVLIVSMLEDEETLVKMLKLGIKGFLSKSVEPTDLHNALQSIANKGFYYTDIMTGKLIEALRVEEINGLTNSSNIALNDREKRFIELACSEYTYKEIADIMCLSVKTIDGYRNALFEKLEVKSRVGLALYAIKHGLVEV